MQMGCSGRIELRTQKPEGSPETNPSYSAQSLRPNTWRNSQPCRGQKTKGVRGVNAHTAYTDFWKLKA